MNQQLQALGQLHFLAAFCPLHKTLSAELLAKIFIPAVNSDCVRFFHNDQSNVCAALIWARLSTSAAERMVHENEPPEAVNWNSGDQLWFLDLLAPFKHGRLVARHIARNPPLEPFYFARLDTDGKIKRVVRGDATQRGPKRLQSFGAERGELSKNGWTS